jgi:hypothetical protein
MAFADVDPVHHLMRRMAHTAEPATLIATLLGHEYTAVFEDCLHRQQACAATCTRRDREP